MINAFLKCCQEVIDTDRRLKNQDDAFPCKVKQNNLHATYSCSTLIMFIASMNLSTWVLGSTSSSGSNLGKSFSGFVGKSFWGPGMARGFIVSHRGLVAMLPPNVKLNWGDGIETKGGLVSGGSWGLEPLAWVSEKLKNVESPWKSTRSTKVSEWAISMMGWKTSEIVSIIRSSMLDVRVSPSSYGWVLLWENWDLGIWYIIGIWQRDLRYARVWRRS